MKSKLSINIRYHGFHSDQLIHDEEVSPPDYGLYGPDVILYFLSRNHLELEYDNRTKLSEICLMIQDYINEKAPYLPPKTHFGHFSFEKDGDFYYPDNDSNYPFADILSLILDPEHHGIINVDYWINCSAGGVLDEAGFHFYMHSNESCRHNLPHVHVSKGDNNAEISLTNYQTLSGSLKNAKDEKKVKKIISENIDYFINAWNTKTTGLTIAINHHFDPARKD